MVAIERPKKVNKLESGLRKVSGEKPYGEVLRIVSNAIVAYLLPDGVVKGGSSLKFRLGDGTTRFTTDLDAARSVSENQFYDRLCASLAQGWSGFTGRVVIGNKANPKDVPEGYVMQPYAIKLSYEGRPWCTVDLEVGHNEIGDADEPEYVVPEEANSYLEPLRFSPLGPVPVMSLQYQVAQKLHALSSPNSQRAHDLIDLQLIVESMDVDLLRTKRVCQRLFEYRRGQEWPPIVVVGENWSSLYEAQRGELPVRPFVDDAVMWVNELIDRIDHSDVSKD